MSIFPIVPQTEYARIPYPSDVGEVWEGELFNENVERGLVAAVTEVAKVVEITIAANNPGDTVGVYIDGGLVVATAGANATATATALASAITTAVGGFLAGVVDTASGALAVVTVTCELGVDPTFAEYSPDATTATPVTTTAAVVQQKLLYGMGVARDIPSATINTKKVKKPSSMSDAFAGVLFKTHGTNLPAAQIEALGFNPLYLCPGYPYSVAKRNMGIKVSFVGSTPAEIDPVYWIKTGVNAGLWRTSSGAVSQVSTLTLTTTATDLVAFNFDGLPDLSIASASGTEATDAANLAAQWVSSAAYAAIGSIVDNLDGTLTITFADDVAHVFTDNSGGTSSIAETIDTAAVAASAELMPAMSWARPSEPTTSPSVAYLRLSNP